MNEVFAKNVVTKAARDAAVAGFSNYSSKKMLDAARCYLSFDEAYLCIAVQHRRLKPKVGYKFCVNFGLQAKVLFAANPFGLEAKHPTEICALFRARLYLGDQSDQWWEPHGLEELESVCSEVTAAARQAWHERIEGMLTVEAHVDHIAGRDAPLYAEARTVLLGELERRRSLRQISG